MSVDTSAGLWAISQGFTDVGKDDSDIVARAGFLYDSLYAHIQRRLTQAAEPHPRQRP